MIKKGFMQNLFLFYNVEKFFQIVYYIKQELINMSIVKNPELKDSGLKKIEWVKSLKPKYSKAVSQDMSIRQNVGLIQNMWMTARNYNSKLATELEENLQKYYPLVRN